MGSIGTRAISVSEPFLKTGTGPSDPARDLFRCSPLMMFPLGRESELIYSPLTKSAQVLPSEYGRLIRTCIKYATVDAHAERISSELNLGPKAVVTIRDKLAQFTQTGLLVSLQSLLQTTLNRALEVQDDVPPISVLGIPTRGRMVELHRALVSYLENIRTYGRTIDFVIADDSPSGTGALCKQLLRSISKQYDINLFYAGREEKLGYAKILVDDWGIPQEVVSFALFGDERCDCLVGANRNTLLLHTVGEPLLSVDDDTVCELGLAPGASGNSDLALCSEVDPTEVWVFSDRGSAKASVNSASEDLLSIHERSLGRGLGQVVSKFSEIGKVNFDAMCPHMLLDLYLGRGTILATHNGVVGDCGMYSSAWLLVQSEGETRKRLLASEASYRSALAWRDLLKCAPCTTICHAGAWRALAWGLDNRILLPPFVPVGRNEDGVFGITLSKCFPAGYFGHLPYALVHDPPQRRSYTISAFDFPSTVRLCDIIIACLGSFRSNSSNTWDSHPTQYLKSLGNHLIEMGSLGCTDFDDSVRTLLWKRASQSAAQLENVLQETRGSPAFWADDVKKCLAKLAEAVASGDEYLIPKDMVGQMGAGQARALTRHFVSQVGQLMYWWPDIVQAAKILRGSGRRIGVRLM